jgi:hypothetical protein
MLATSSRAGERYAATGLVLQVDRTSKSWWCHAKAFPNVMDAMVMSFRCMT